MSNIAIPCEYVLRMCSVGLLYLWSANQIRNHGANGIEGALGERSSSLLSFERQLT